MSLLTLGLTCLITLLYYVIVYVIPLSYDLAGVNRLKRLTLASASISYWLGY